MLASDSFDDEQRQTGARAILRQAVRLEQLVKNFLEVAKLESGVQQANLEDIDITELAGRVADEFRAVNPDRSIEVRASRSAWATGQQLWVEQILSNLVANAVTYSAAGASVEVTVTESPAGVALSVTDHGEGIPPGDLERIFDRFERLNSQVQNGTGLGLYIVQQFATALGAAVAVESRAGEGSTFTLTLRPARKLRIVS